MRGVPISFPIRPECDRDGCKRKPTQMTCYWPVNVGGVPTAVCLCDYHSEEHQLEIAQILVGHQC